MDRWLLALVVGMVGGAGGAAAVHVLWPTEPAAEAGETAAFPRDLTSRLDRIENALADMRALPGLSGTAAPAPPPPAPAAPPENSAADSPAAWKAIAKQVAEDLDRKIAEREAAKEAAKAEAAAKNERKRLALSDAAREIGLSASEEAEVRRIYASTQDRLMKILADPDGDVEAVRRDIEAAQKNPRTRGAVMMKYIPKVLPHIGEFVSAGVEQDAAVAAAVGEEKADRLKSYDIIEANPIGMGADMNVRAGGR